LVEEDSAMPPRRRTKRNRVFRSGKIIFGYGDSTIDCLILDESSQGVLVETAAPTEVPEKVQIQIIGRGTFRAIRRWALGNSIGFEFVESSNMHDRTFVAKSEKQSALIMKLHALMAADAPPRMSESNYPSPFSSRMAGRIKHSLGDLFSLKNFGVNLTHLKPGAVSSLHHKHSRQDEFIYVVSGGPILCVDDGEIQLRAGMVSGFAAGGTAHHLENRTDQECVILEVGDRAKDDQVSYPDDDIKSALDETGKRKFSHKNGKEY
jgi:uncharacterized cupin superfamily protein